MTKSTITREQLTEWVAQLDSDGGCDATDKQLETLIRQSLAAMDSEPEYLPLDYLQGHRDGLEWSARLAESNHPQTGDWLYDDPIELAKAIRKGPDMPPVQQAPVVPVVPDEMTPEQAHEIGDYYGDPVDVFARAANWMRQHIIDSTLAAEPQSPGSEPATVPGKWIPVREQMPESKPGSYEYLVFETLNNRVNHDYWNVPDKGDEAFTPFWNYYGEHVTHWQPMPAAPQEVSMWERLARCWRLMITMSAVRIKSKSS